jgi:hypothetical protein
MRRLLSLGCLLTIFLNSHAEDEQIIWPLIQNEHLISGTFGEYRPSHIHLGLDIRTPGQTGVPVRAVADGFISQIRVRPNGYGRVLFFTYDSNRIATYCHLQSFNKELEDYLIGKQYEVRSFSQDFILTPEDFTFRQGEVIAYSGRSGTIRPHLHFEIRSPQGYALNPLTQGLSIKDTCPPKFSKFAVIPLSGAAEVDGDCRPKVYKTLRAKEGNYHLISTPQIYGDIGFAIAGRDYADGSANPLMFYSGQATLDDSLIYSVIFDSCGFDAYYQGEIDRDPYLRHFGRGDFIRFFSSPNCDLSYYEGYGVIDATHLSLGRHLLIVTIDDYNGNCAVLQNEIEVIPQPAVKNPLQFQAFALTDNKNLLKNSSIERVDVEYFSQWLRVAVFPPPVELFLLSDKEYSVIFPDSSTNTANRIAFQPEMIGPNSLVSVQGRIFDSWILAYVNPDSAVEISSGEGDFRVFIPPDGVYEDLYIALKSPEPSTYYLEPAWMPLKRRATLRWEISDSSARTGLYHINSSGKPTFLSNNRDTSGALMAKSADLGAFTALRDDNPPSLLLTSPRLDRAIRKSKPEFRFKISDDLSGIDSESIEITIDGEWILAEYDQPRHSVKTRLLKPLTQGKHKLIFKLQDKCGNETKKSFNFRTSG